LTRVTCFEWGSEFYINPVQFEHAAAFLRDVEVGPSYPPLPLFDRTASGRQQPSPARVR
jgi:hypothetical protein